MKISAKIEYAYKAVLELSLRYNNDVPVQISSISEAQGIPKKFLVQLLLRLKNANLVNSTRGIAGGYYLARAPAQITLADLFRAIDEEIVSLPKEKRSPQGSEAARLFFEIWRGISKEVVNRLEQINFEQLIYRLKNEQLTYQI
ncbi:MAG: Rrf2 family transcriptional regulator [Candidatus Omnitrophica bacterium]|nr:Rrf2 family transcriptional regulator [Candidatus Omnitrophota bacterium]MDD5513583.1 Rrf2 family transcriptional regulator [Candidatus Omnitrophota bacterium]